VGNGYGRQSLFPFPDDLFGTVEYTVSLTVTDDDGSTTANEVWTVYNVAPELWPPSGNMIVYEGVPFVLSIAFSDPGTLDTHTAQINWGDGHCEAGTVSGNTVLGNHVYSTAGSWYTVEVTVWDDDGGAEVGKVTVEVLVPEPTTAALLAIGLAGLVAAGRRCSDH
jgi:hypothetical protein